MPALSPQQLASNVSCLRCLTGESAPQVETYLWAVVTGITTNPQQLVNDANAYQSFSPVELQAAKTYLLALDAGGSLDPNVLSIDARCFECDDGVLDAIRIFILATVASVTTDPNGLLALANGFQGIGNYGSVQVAILAEGAGQSFDQVEAGMKCFLCLSGLQNRVQTMLMEDSVGGVLP